VYTAAKGKLVRSLKLETSRAKGCRLSGKGYGENNKRAKQKCLLESPKKGLIRVIAAKKMKNQERSHDVL
jgi:hypothetical protein